MKMNISLILILTLAFLITASGCSTYAAVKTTDISITESTSALDETKEPTEMAAVTTTAKPTQKVTATPTPTVKETTAATTTKASETTAPAATSKATEATTKETAKPTPKPTKETTAETDAPAATTAAPPVETAAPTWTAPTYTENCDAIRNQIVQYCIDNGLWFPDAEATGGDEKGWSIGYASADNQYAESFIRGKIFGDVGIQSVNCWIADGYIYISNTNCALPAA